MSTNLLILMQSRWNERLIIESYTTREGNVMVIYEIRGSGSQLSYLVVLRNFQETVKNHQYKSKIFSYLQSLIFTMLSRSRSTELSSSKPQSVHHS